jgi:oligo-1,6-glucosidase
MLLTLRGTTFLYQGDELGMTNYPFTELKQFNDIEIKNAYAAKVTTKQMPLTQFLAESRRFGRDNSRTPMQWDGTGNAGFTTAQATPWLAVNPNYKTVNAAQELADPNSVFHFTQRLIALRHAHQALVYGDYQDLDPGQMQVFAFTRTLGAEHFLTVLNFTGKDVSYTLPGGIRAGRLEISNLPTAEANTATLKLRPWEARIYRF